MINWSRDPGFVGWAVRRVLGPRTALTAADVPHAWAAIVDAARSIGWRIEPGVSKPSLCADGRLDLGGVVFVWDRVGRWPGPYRTFCSDETVVNCVVRYWVMKERKL